MTSPNILERLFKLSENQTTVRTEVAAGVTTFLTMAYIIFVNPAILAEAGVPFSGALFATCMRRRSVRWSWAWWRIIRSRWRREWA